MSTEEIERILSDFRAWLGDLTAIPAPVADSPKVDLYTLIAQFTALRQEVNLQTKASRTSLKQNAEALTELRSALEQLQEQPEDDGLGPLLKAVVDVYDNLTLALKQVTKQRAAIERPLAELVDGTKNPELEKLLPPLPDAKPARGIWARLFSAQARANIGLDKGVVKMMKVLNERTERTEKAASLVRSSLDSLITGYRMSLARIDRVLEQSDMEPIAAVGETFDPELMEVVEVVGESGSPAGQVVEEVRRGYIRGEVVFRFAQVKVAR
ncbi:MAG: nucleotide exchange factor GrpE [Gemmataceae bacterium]|nr:nucleotide exchange factor GrpE [Gemmataceae bacterium]